MELIPGLYQITGADSGPVYSDDYDCNCYLWEYEQGEFALFDAGAGRNVPELLRRIDKLTGDVRRVRYLFLTHHHADHIGGAAALRRETGALTVASAHCAHLIEAGDEQGIGLEAARNAGGYPPDYRIEGCIIDRLAGDGEVWQLGCQKLWILSTPGHCRGAISFLWDMSGKRILVSGDTVFQGGAISLLSLPDCSLSEYKETIAKLDTMSIDALLPGHLGAILKRASGHIHKAKIEFDKLRIPISFYHLATILGRNNL
ncbi:MBL fold metallo-hydrolase [Paenibacillus solisilvae]|uniref:MBL fold metallo-hydrolase n=1 Tax=Paenibacillus solisilvae TaxID=2486751 RepID=A0ABW0VP98_9BACL